MAHIETHLPLPLPELIRGRSHAAGSTLLSEISIGGVHQERQYLCMIILILVAFSTSILSGRETQWVSWHVMCDQSLGFRTGFRMWRW